MEINEWEILTKSHVISPEVINEQVRYLSKISQDLAKEAIVARGDLTLCGEISYYKNIVNQIKQKALKGINPPSNLVSSPSNLNLNTNRVLQHELNIFTIDSPNYQSTHKSDKVLNPYRFELESLFMSIRETLIIIL